MSGQCASAWTTTTPRRVLFRRPVRSHRRMGVIVHLVLRFPSDPATTLVALTPPDDKYSFSCGRAAARDIVLELPFRKVKLPTGARAGISSIDGAGEKAARPAPPVSRFESGRGCSMVLGWCQGGAGPAPG